jgi:predicted GH43/DUF377 family glycosyl hydrolase
MHDLHIGGLATYALKRGGEIHPIIIPREVLGGEDTGLMNPSIFLDGDRMFVNVRHINYILYHSEGKKFPHQWGPLVYIHPEDDVKLGTHNILCEYDKDFKLLSAGRVNMVLDTKPTWNFVGLEDARLFKWDDKMYLCGVRRDCYDDKGTGRMEMCHVEHDGTEWKEISRHPIPAPNGDKSYCEKNWMPILDMPWHFVKWSNPTQVVKFNIEEGTCEDAVQLSEDQRANLQKDLRGGSQVIRIDDNKQMAFCHETNLLKDSFFRKDGNYAHRVVVWDNDWNIIHTSKEFHFMGTYYDHAKSQEFNIEFVTGVTFTETDILISFGLSDNASYILKMPQGVFFDFLTKV